MKQAWGTPGGQYGQHLGRMGSGRLVMQVLGKGFEQDWAALAAEAGRGGHGVEVGGEQVRKGVHKRDKAGKTEKPTTKDTITISPNRVLRRLRELL